MNQANEERWQRVNDIYRSALSLSESERAVLIASVSESDEALGLEVESLLQADASSGDFLNSSSFELGLKVLMNESLNTSETVTFPEGTVLDKFTGTAVAGRYLIERELGRGGVGAVYLARDQKLHDKPVVVKVLLEKSLRDDWVVQKFRQEKEALARLDHPGIVSILDTGELTDGKPFIVMQYVNGISLRAAIKFQSEGLDLTRVASIVKQIGTALTAVHDKKIYHRDLKPENIMLQPIGERDEQVKIVDFGIAKIRESVVAPSTVTGAATAGTIIYMSPEQLRAHKVTSASDIYSFGVIAYELVTGRRPFNPDTVVQLSEMQREGVRVKPADLRPRLSPEAQSLILKALAFDRLARPQDAAEFGNALAAALVNEGETLDHFRRPDSPQPIVIPDQPDHPSKGDTIPDVINPVSFRNQSHRKVVDPVKRSLALPLAIAGVLIVLLAVGAYVVVSKRALLFGSTEGSQRSLVYSLNVQKMRDGKPYEAPFQSSGQEIFEKGYKFRLNVSSPQSGYLYVFNEGADEKTGTSFTIIYPTPATNNGSAKIDADQAMQTNWNTFAGEAGTEEFWIVWSGSPVTEMETARDAAFKNTEGALSDSALIGKVKAFLTTNADRQLETTKDRAKQQTTVRGNSDLLVKLVELEHR